ncbi:MAG: LuxR family transcriptional regulator [Ancylobacter novellus]|uniref:LuxR family transcriptional regulator n=1 Tax=Ancylobacter novellus TaxID=921 RepID=A0A2W5KQ54_ANCNO|nr:MAG: LuxR family transcriptional regulator [Ancylobacter novellus]
MVTSGTIPASSGLPGLRRYLSRPETPRVSGMTSAIARSRLPSIDGPEWFALAGETIASIGTAYFHRELIKLLEASIRSEAVWIIRYSGEAPPDVVYTHNVPDSVRKIYDERCSGVDPFSMRWKTRREAGVFTLATLRDESVEYLLYTKIFLGAAEMEDELGVFFPVTAHNCFAFFLEREHGLFSESEVARARLIFPALESFYRAHLGWLFNELRYADAPEASGLINRPTLIQDRSGQTVYASEGWNALAEAETSLAAALATLSGGADAVEFGALVLKSEALGADFPLAPGGRMVVAERDASHYRADRLKSLSGVLDIFTPRERDILDLAMRGMNSAEIGERLNIGVGSVKNVKMRLYRKAEVSTERELVKKFMPLYEPS